MSCEFLLLTTVCFWNVFFALAGGLNRTCFLEEIFACGEGETCKQSEEHSPIGYCTCVVNNVSVSLGEPCPQAPPPKHDFDFKNSVSVTAIATGLLVPVFSIGVIIGLVFLARRHRWFRGIREQTHHLAGSNNYDTILVGRDDESIG